MKGWGVEGEGWGGGECLEGEERITSKEEEERARRKHELLLAVELLSRPWPLVVWRVVGLL